MSNNLLRRIFSIVNDDETYRTILYILGFKFKIFNKFLIKRPDYSNALQKIQKKYLNGEKIRVAFYVTENSKWNAEVLYDLLQKDDKFEPFILTSVLNSAHNGNDKLRYNLQENYLFFLKSSKKVYNAYNEEKREFIPFSKFNIDIIFYQQQYEIPKCHSINNISKETLTMYYNYGISVLDINAEMVPFHEILFSYFIPNDTVRKSLSKYKNLKFDNSIVVGYPKLDVYNYFFKNNHPEKKNLKKTIIYAPHHSYQIKKKKDIYTNIGTFIWSGEKILNFAKEHSEYNWIFKPHPRLKTVLYNDKNFGKEFTEKYYADWASIGTSYEYGNYFELFMNSDLLITDCDSFLIEYMPTGKPIIRLEKDKCSKISENGKKILEGIYNCKTFNMFEQTFKEVFINNNDIYKNKRSAIVSRYILNERCASENIVKFLKKICVENLNTKGRL